jgi:hypothetical protein
MYHTLTFQEISNVVNRILNPDTFNASNLLKFFEIFEICPVETICFLCIGLLQDRFELGRFYKALDTEIEKNKWMLTFPDYNFGLSVPFSTLLRNRSFYLLLKKEFRFQSC